MHTYINCEKIYPKWKCSILEMGLTMARMCCFDPNDVEGALIGYCMLLYRLQEVWVRPINKGGSHNLNSFVLFIVGPLEKIWSIFHIFQDHSMYD